MSQKIAVVSLDHWHFDKHIVDALRKRGEDAFHIRIGGFRHKNCFVRLGNAFSKFFLGKNLKIKKRQDHIINCLEKRGKQDQILVINPEIIELDYHLKIRAYTDKYICYLYDSVDRYNVTHLLNGVFDEIYSFDRGDVEKYGFKEATNYFYVEYEKIPPHKIKRDLIYVGSIDERIAIVNDLAEYFKKHDLTFRLYAIGKGATAYKFRQIFKGRYKNITFQRKFFSQAETLDLYRSSRVIVDIVRKNQTGLSFRVFEAMPFEKKVITNNGCVLCYDFYNSNNVLVIDDKLDFFGGGAFFKANYESLPEAVYWQYGIDCWVAKVFNLGHPFSSVT